MPAGIRVHNHNDALDILKTRCDGLALEELKEFWHRMPLIRFEGKSEKNASLEFLQTCMNPLINDVLKNHYGWHTQVDLPGGTKVNNFDFYKRFANDLRVWMEVEFANSARIDSDIRKLRTAYKRGLSDVGILVVCTDALAPRVDLNIATFESAFVTILDEECNDFPCLILGIERNTAKVVDVTRWGYALEHLKRESNQDIKSGLAHRIWTECMLPTLPQDSMHARHLERVKILGFNPGAFKPTFPEFKEKLIVKPDVLTWNEDGSFTVFQEESKPKRGREKSLAKPTALLNEQLPLELEPAQSAEAAVTLWQQAQAIEVVTVQAPSRHIDTLRFSEAVKAEASSLETREAVPPIVVKSAPTELPRKTVQVRPDAGGPRLGPWLSRAGATASPFISSFA